MFQTALVALGGLLVLLVPGLWEAQVFSRTFSELQTVPLATFTVAFLISAGRLAWTSRRRSITVWDSVATTVTMLGLASLALLASDRQRIYQQTLALSALGSVGLSVLLFAVHGFQRTKLAMLAVTLTLAATLHGLYFLHVLPRKSAPEPADLATTSNSTLYGVDIQRYAHHIVKPFATGGGLALLPQGYLLATGDGILYAINEDAAARTLEARELKTRVPLNSADFIKASAGLAVNAYDFRVADILARVNGSQITLLANHHYWNAAANCFTIRVSRFDADYARFLSGDEAGTWTTIFESTPCLPIKDTTGFSEARAFQGIQIGGRLAWLGPDSVLLEVGDQEFDGVNSTVSYPQDMMASYGKTLLLDLRAGTSSIFSRGHRNAQGLFVDSGGTIWETEHGPEGGDELNTLTAGANYGWPIVTYGVQYGTHDWPLNPRQGAHDGYTEPLFAWTPSIGVSNLIRIEGDLWERWRGDLIVSSLEGRSLFRLRLVNGRPVMVEPIEVGVRVRDIIEGHSGELVLWSRSDAELLFLRPSARGQTGAQLFGRCSSCHVVANGATHGQGPDLGGILGRPIASAPGFDYSGALRAKRGIWSPATLSAFIEDPSTFAPGTTMQVPGIADENARRLLVEYLTTAGQP